LHAGHARLLETAFASARRVGIGLTTDAYLARHPKPLGGRIAPYTLRRRRLRKYLLGRWPESRWWIVPLEDGWGGAVEPGAEVLVASEMTRAGAEAVNAERARRGLPPLLLNLIPTVRAEDGLPVASRRIRAGTIAPNGRRLRSMRVAYSGPSSLAPVAARELRRRWPHPAPRIVRVGSRGRTPPERAPSSTLPRRALALAERHDLGIAVALPTSGASAPVLRVAVGRPDGSLDAGWHRLAREESPGPVLGSLLGRLLAPRGK
jgi:phosphopantetheine adenylyltransferase